MKHVQLTFPGENAQYQVRIGSGLLPHLAKEVADLGPQILKSGSKAAIFGDAQVLELYLPKILPSFQQRGIQTITHGFRASETTKNLSTIEAFYNILTQQRAERKTPVIALGGGIAGDVVGFVAASYLRGLPFIQVPTTLLSMVDASVGGKVGVNLAAGKNLVGAFYQPLMVLVDVDVLETLNQREFRAGLAECIKHAIICDPELFSWTEKHKDEILAKDKTILEELIRRNVEIKARIVMGDEKEQGERALLNLGHTFAHAIESATSYTQFLHGEAVSLGLVAAAELSYQLGKAPQELRTRIERILAFCGLPIRAPLPAAEVLIEAMNHDKKVVDATLRFILPTAIGSAEITLGAPHEKIVSAWTVLNPSL